MGYKIAIDGPAGAGKSYLAKEISKKLNILYIDTGAMYRAFGVYVSENKINLEDTDQVERALNKCNIYFKNINDENLVYMNSEEVTKKIRTEQAAMMASEVSAINVVRQDMIKRQRKMGEMENVIMEGRDIGSVVFKEADLKIHLTADINKRAKRRLNDLLEKGIKTNVDKVIADIQKRDYADINKKISPLIKTKDSIEIDTTNMSKEEMVEFLLNIIKNKGLLKQ